MSKITNFLKSEKWTILSMFLTVLSAILGTPFMMAAETILPVTEEGAKASEGSAGLETQVTGATTVSAAKDAGGELIQPDIDEEIFLIGTDETILDGIMRKAKRKIKVTGYEVDHYLIDEQKATAEVAEKYTGSSQKTATIKVADDDVEMFKEYGTFIAKGVSGYTEDGKTAIPGSDLMLYVVGNASEGGYPIVRAINGPKTSPTDMYCNVPTIEEGTILVRLANACAETQKEVAPDFIVPTPQRVFLQKTIMNQIFSDYFENQRKRIPFGKAVIAEAMIKEYRRKNNRTLWIGRKGKIKLNRGAMGVQDVYFTEGLRWQFKREWEHSGAWTFADIIALAKLKFTGQNCSKKALWLMGRDLMEGIQNIDFTLHKDITMTKEDFWGFSCTRLHTVFGDFYLIHEPTLDVIGYSNSGGIIDEQGIVRYYLKNEEASEEDVQGEEAKRKALISINALALKGYSHIWVNCEGTSDGLPGVTVVTEWANSSDAPTEPTLNQVFYLKQACTGISGSKAGELWKWNGESWSKYEGEIYAKDGSI